MLGLRITHHTPPGQFKLQWHVIDASGQRLGRLATSVAGLLQGKHKPDYSRHLLNGDFVVVVNAVKVEVSGRKLAQKTYYHHTGFPGSLKAVSLEGMLAKHPERVIQRAVKGMLPGNRLGRRMLGRLKVYSGPTHPHEAQVNAGQGQAKKAVLAKVEAPARPRRKSATAEAVPAPATRRRAAPARATTPRRSAASPAPAKTRQPRPKATSPRRASPKSREKKT